MHRAHVYQAALVERTGASKVRIDPVNMSASHHGDQLGIRRDGPWTRTATCHAALALAASQKFLIQGLRDRGQLFVQQLQLRKPGSTVKPY